MTAASDLIVRVLQEGWKAISATIVAYGLLAVLVQTLRGVGAASLGYRRGVAFAISSTLGVSFLLVFAGLGLPALVKSVRVSLVQSHLCEPVIDLGAAAAGMIAALASIRMLLATVRSISGLFVGSISDGRIVLEIGEALLGMLAVVVAGPTAAHFLGAC